MTNPQSISPALQALLPSMFDGQPIEQVLEAYVLVLESLPMNVSLLKFVDADTLIVQNANAIARRMAQGRPILGENLYSFVPPSSIARVKQNVLACIETRAVVQSEDSIDRGTGTLFWIQNTMIPIIDQHDVVTHIVSFSQDFTERKQQEMRLLEQHEVIQQQSEALAELSTPLLVISDSAVVMPLVGSIDTQRIHLLTTTLLEGVAHHNTKYVIIDITGVPVVDTQVANALISAGRAVNLMGTKVILSGIRPEVAQILVSLGISFEHLVTHSTLQQAIAATQT